ncbi:MAG: hypothetical protein ACOCUY_01040 [Verrucomicrobiota bacterium]
MKILDDRTLHVLWSWSELDKTELEHRFKTGLLALLKTVRSRGGEKHPALEGKGTAALADELAEAGAILDECAANCMTLASTLRAENGLDEQRIPKRLEGSLGQKVVLSRTNVKELQEGPLVLADVEDENGVIGKGDEYWQTPLNRLLVLPRERTGEGDAEQS